MTPPGASALKLEDPRLPFMMARPSVTDEASEAERPFVYLQPQAGTVLMWESWLRHEVPTNQAKSDHSADEWLPASAAARCDLVGRQVKVKAKWGLSVSVPERAAMQQVLASCA